MWAVTLALRPKFVPPQFLAVHVETQNTIVSIAILALDAARHKDPITPHNRRRRAHAGQLCFPSDAVGTGKLDRVVPRASSARVLRSPPLRPVFLGRGNCALQGEDKR